VTPVLPRAEVKLRGLHNVENLLAAIAAVWGRVPVDVMRQVGSTFTGVEHRIEPVRGQCLRVKVRVLAHSLFNARCGCPHQHQHLNMCHDFRCQRLIGDFFVIAARNQDDLLVKAAQARNGAGGAGCDGVIVIRYAIQHANRLNAVFHAGKGRANLTHDIHRNAGGNRTAH